MRRFRLILFAGGLALLVWLVLRSGPRLLARDLLDVGWWMAALVAVMAVRCAFRAGALRLALGEDRRQFSFGAAYLVVMVSSAVQFVAVAGLLFGQTAKGWLLARRVSGPRAVSTVMIDMLLFYLTGALFVLGGIVLFFAWYPASPAVRAAGLASAALVAVAVLVGVAAFRRRWFRARGLVGLLSRWGMIRRRETIERAGDIDRQMFDFCARFPGRFRKILVLDLSTHFLLAFEAMVILRLLGLGAGYGAGIVVETLTKIVGLGGLLVPGDVGLYQGGSGLILHAMGYSVAAGVAFGIIRQIRSILWAGIGFLGLLAPGSGRRE